MADQYITRPDLVKHYSRGPTIPVSGRSYFNITCPFCGTHTRAYVWSIRGGGKKCENKKCRAKFDAWGNAYPLAPKPAKVPPGRPEDFGEQGIGIGGMKGDD